MVYGNPFKRFNYLPSQGISSILASREYSTFIPEYVSNILYSVNFLQREYFSTRSS